jgi:hypothetical protein
MGTEESLGPVQWARWGRCHGHLPLKAFLWLHRDIMADGTEPQGALGGLGQGR